MTTLAHELKMQRMAERARNRSRSSLRVDWYEHGRAVGDAIARGCDVRCLAEYTENAPNVACGEAFYRGVREGARPSSAEVVL